MLGGDNGNTVLPLFVDENSFQCHTNASNQLHLFGNLPVDGSIDPVNYFGNGHITPVLQPMKRSREAEDIFRKKQKVQNSSNNSICHGKAVDRLTSIRNQNPVSTGLRLSCDDDDQNSSVTSASGNMGAAQPIVLSFVNDTRTEFDQQKNELDQYIKIQEENLVKGVKDIMQKHMASLLTAIKKRVIEKLRKKDIEIENVNRMNRELDERTKQAVMEAHNWHERAKHNESMVEALRNKLRQVIGQGASKVKEGFGDSEMDDAASYINPNYNHLGIQGGPVKADFLKDSMICKACNLKEVCMLLIPCKHLCLCKECEQLISVCLVCQLAKTCSIQVYLS